MGTKLRSKARAEKEEGCGAGAPPGRPAALLRVNKGSSGAGNGQVATPSMFRKDAASRCGSLHPDPCPCSATAPTVALTPRKC